MNLLIHELFERQVACSPDVVAVIDGGGSVSFAEVNGRANQLARFLRARGVGAGDVVGVCVERGVGLVVGLLGVLKAGAAYVPLDPQYPVQRLGFMLADAAPRLVLTGDGGLPVGVAAGVVEVVGLDAARGVVAGFSREDLARPGGLTVECAAYVIYTSGSTGRPKGVVMSHAVLVNLLAWHVENGLGAAGVRVLQFAASSFDVAFQDTFSTLCSGGTLVVADEVLRRDPRRLREFLAVQRIGRVFLPPLMLQALAEAGGAEALQLADVVVAGEQLHLTPEIARFFEGFDGARLHNHYGPTETHVVTSWTLAGDPQQWPQLPPIGAPIAGARVYVLDDRLQPVSVGQTGEIYVGGVAVARGYLNRAGLTGQRFVADPLSGDAGVRMYRTGDVGRVRGDGGIDFVGRGDDQVKIRGFRVELGEVEAQVAAHELVRQAVVAARADGSGGVGLVAYVTAADGGAPSVESLRAHVAALLPGYMVPAAFVVVDCLPVTASGKVDRRALPAPGVDAFVSAEYEPPVGQAEQLLAEVWQELLPVGRIGRGDNFFALGGHSLLIARLLQRLDEAGYAVDPQVVYQTPTLAAVAKALTPQAAGGVVVPPNGIAAGCEVITPEMLPLVDLEPEHIEAVVATVAGGVGNVEDVYPLTGLQEGMLFHHVLASGGGDTYVLPILWELSSEQAAAQLVAALHCVIDRHDVLRTAVLWEQLPQPVQVVYRRAVLPVQYLVLEDPRAGLEERMRPERLRLDVRQAPLLRLQVARNEDGSVWCALLVVHHLVCDHESLDTVLAEVMAYVDGRGEQLARPAAYRDQVAAALGNARTSSAEDFFRQKLGMVHEPTAPFGLQDVRGGGGNARTAEQALDPVVAQQLRSCARRWGVNAAAVFHAGWALVVAHTSGREDAVFGTLMGRLHAGSAAQQAVGLSINTLPVRVSIGEVSVAQLVAGTFGELAQLLPYEQASLAAAQKCSGVPAGTPLFTSLLNYLHGTPTSQSGGPFAAAGVRVLEVKEWTNYPISLSVTDDGEGFWLTAQTDGVDPQRIVGYTATVVQELVQALQQAPQTPAWRVPMLAEPQRQHLLVDFNQAPTPVAPLTRAGGGPDIDAVGTLVALFAQRVALSPDAIAAVCADRQLTYGGLDLWSNRLAHWLFGRGVGVGDVVAVQLGRSLEWVAVIWAVVKAAAVYVPVDPQYPQLRKDFLIADSGAQVVVDAVPGVDELAGLSDSAPAVSVSATHAAYMVYTSGSTGAPKGVVVGHGSVTRYARSMSARLAIGAGSRVLALASPGFDASVCEWVTAAAGGAALVVAPAGVVAGQELADVLVAQRVSHAFVPPAVLATVPPLAVGTLQTLIVGGEACAPELVARWAVDGRVMVNAYGPTEITVDATVSDVLDPQAGVVPIGRPLGGVRVFVVDRWLQPVPVGVAGELYVAGSGVAQCYWGQAGLTSARFVADVFSGVSGGRLYRTGDVVRWDEWGQLEFVGRADDQVKINGVRVEPAEPAAVLAECQLVGQAVVVARDDDGSGNRLVAYVTPADPAVGVDVSVLRGFVAGRAPAHLVPAAFVVLDAFPLTANQKVDRRALPAPEQEAYVRGANEPPQGEIEQILAGIWLELLPVDRVGRWDNFFELGGHSLLIVALRERLQRVGLAVAAGKVFQTPRLADLARMLRHGGAQQIVVPPNAIAPGCELITPAMLPLVDLQQQHIDQIVHSVPGGAPNVQDIYPLAPLQEGLLFHHLLDGDGDAYVSSNLLRLSSRERLQDFVTALQQVIDRHDVLRTMLVWEGLPAPVQVVLRQVSVPVQEITLDAARDPVQQLTERMNRATSLDLRRAPLLQLQCVPAAHGAQWYALLHMHHVAGDAEAMRVMISEVAASMQGRGQQLPVAVGYRNHVAEALAYSSGDDAATFFRSKLGDIEEPTAPFGVVDVRVGSRSLVEAQQQLPPGLAEGIRSQARRLQVSVATLFHAAWGLVVAHTSGRDQAVFGTVLLGRMQGNAGGQRILGLFINTLPLRLRLAGTAAELVAETQREVVALLAHEHASLAVAQRCSGISGSAPLFTSLFNYRHSGSEEQSWETAGIEVVAGVDRSNYPISLDVDDLADALAMRVQTEHRIDAQAVLGYTVTALESLVAALEGAPDTPALRLPIVPERERQHIVESFNPARVLVQDPRHVLLHELFEEHVAKNPDSAAVVCGDGGLTYSELNAEANRLAHFLRELGVGPEAKVAICLRPGLAMVVGVVAVLKAGGAYVPLDPNYPQERLKFQLTDSAALVLLTDVLGGQAVGGLEELTGGLAVIDCQKQADRWAQCSPLNVSAASVGLCETHAAYVIYTSGSTGRPKGVVVEHRNICSSVVTRCDVYGGYERFLLLSSLSFDSSTAGIFGTLASGGTLFIPDSIVDPRALGERLAQWNITSILGVPLLLNALVEACPPELGSSLRQIITAGEACTTDLVEKISGWAPNAGVFNEYGPTEATVWATMHRCNTTAISGGPVPIGRPIAHARVYILDGLLQPVPVGVVGEICIGGASVGRGYLNRPDLTAQRFVRDPFDVTTDARMYLTGDLGRWRGDGTVEFLGRNDEQVKVRGFRIELGEIQAQLVKHPLVREAVVLPCADSYGGKRLVGYVTATDSGVGLDISRVRDFLAAQLPAHMVPAGFIVLESLPLTANGKVDRRALPAPGRDAYLSGAYESPRGELEQVLAGIWLELLPVARVGRWDNFFELGGHSLLIVALRERLRQVGLSVEVRQVFDKPVLADLAAALLGGEQQVVVPPNGIPAGCEAITPEMLPLVALRQEHIDRIVQGVPGGAGNVQDIYPMAPLQEGLLFHHLVERDRDAYVSSNLFVLPSRERLQELVAALEQVVARHDILRTLLVWEDVPVPVQVVVRQASVPIREIAVAAGRDAVEQLTEVMHRGQRLDLRKAPLLRWEIAQDVRGPQWYAVLTFHHLVCDHESQEILFAEMLAFVRGRAQQLPPPVGFRNHVAEALAYSAGEDARSFFGSRLGDVEEPTAPFGLVDAQVDGSRIGEVVQQLEAALADGVRAVARRWGVSVATLFHVAWALVVAHTSGREEAVFGTVLLGRMQGSAGAQHILGMFINTLPLRVPLTGSAADVVAATAREVVALLAHEHASLAVAQQCSGVAGSTPLFTALLNYRHSASDEPQWDSVGIGMVEGLDRTNYPMMLSVDDFSDGFALTAQTDCSIDAQLVLDYTKTALQSIVAALDNAPDTPAAALSILPARQRQRVLDDFNQTQVHYPAHMLVHDAFELQAARTPEAVAVVDGARSLTYSELNGKANQLARYLRQRGIGADDVVGVCAQRSLEIVVGLVGILKAGAAYLPLDPQYPAQRIEDMLADAAPAVVLTSGELPAGVRAKPAAVLALGKALAEVGDYSPQNLARAQGVTAASAVYVIYTSGSTGRPKGVVMSHAALVNLVLWHRDGELGAAAGQRVLQFAAASFDVAFQDTFSTLCTGGTLVLVAEDVRRDAPTLLEFLAAQQIQRVFVPPLMLQALAEQAGSRAGLALVDVIAAGEQLRITPEVVRFFDGLDGARLHNHYGPTETHVVSSLTLQGDPHHWPQLVPVGSAISNARIYVLDARLEPVPVGVVGEIYIAGTAVARGYVNRPRLTALRFVADAFSAGGQDRGDVARGADPHARMYKTGDLGRWRADGTLELLGRNDEQVKIRGFRVELGEIEAHLAAHPQVKDVVVLARDDTAGGRRLVAYVTAAVGGEPSVEALRAHLKALLPQHMVPAAFVVLKGLPVTANGKLDRRALPAPGHGAYASGDYEPPRGEVEQILAGIWQQLLPVGRVGRWDNFFEAGGHSLLIVQLRERLRRVGLAVEVRQVFNTPVLADLAGALLHGEQQIVVPPNGIPAGCQEITPAMLPLVELDAAHIDQIVRTVPGGAENVADIYPLAPMQEGLLFHHLLQSQGSDTYVLSTLFSAPSQQQLQALIAALQKVIDRHDILRTLLVWEDLPAAVQVVLRQVSLPVQQVTLDADRDAVAQLTERMNRGWRLDLQRAPLLRLEIAQDVRGGGWYAVLVFHHLICDHESLDVMFAEMLAYLQGRGHQLPPAVGYRQHVAEALAYASEKDSQGFFRGRLGDIEEPTAPFGLLDVRVDGEHSEEVQQQVEPVLAKRIRAQARALGVSAATLFHAAWALVVAHTSGREEAVFGTVLLGRMQGSAGAQHILGMFINTLPLRVSLEGTVSELVANTQREVVALLAHEQASLALAQRCSGVAGAAPLFTALFNYRHSPGDDDEWIGTGIEILADADRTNYPISLSVDDKGDVFGLVVQTDRRIDTRQVASYTSMALGSLVDALEAAPHTPAVAVPILPEAQRQQLLTGFNATRLDYPPRLLVHELFEAQVASTPDAVAVVHQGHSLTYTELNGRANQLARYLRGRGVGADTVVGLCLSRGIDLVVGLLGIVKTGGAYVPLDPQYPGQRLRFMLEDAAPPVLLIGAQLPAALHAVPAEVISLAHQPADVAGESPLNVPRPQGMTAQSAVYAIYTSGSTGTPKGVVMSHQVMVNLLLWHRDSVGAGVGQRVLQFAASSFDVAFQDTFSTLCTGGTLVLVDEELRRDAHALRQFLAAQQIQRMFLPPLMLQALAEEPEGARLPLADVVVAGEQLQITPEIVRFFQQLDGARLHNHYGPTETHVATSHTLDGDPQRWPRLPPIGRPIANAQVFVLDGRLQPVPVGVSGEIYIGGVPVARGYLNRPELTQQRFVCDPFAGGQDRSRGSARMYRTGDVGRWRADGTLEFLGRNDDQVKIRGYRIEVGEIETQLAAHPQVKDAVVVRADTGSGKRLVAYVTALEPGRPTAEMLRLHLQALLPEHMVPAAFVLLESLPVTPSGKVDRRALPAPGEDAYANAKYEPPQGAVEQVLAGIWQKLLPVARVGRWDNFFDVGGHSLIATRVVAHIRHEFAVVVPLTIVFDAPTIESLGRHIAQQLPDTAAETS